MVELIPSKNQRGFFDLAAGVARKSAMKHRLGAVLVKSGRVLNVGWNQERHNPDHHGIWSLHAEIDACLGCNAPIDGADLYVARITRTGQLALARPCGDCETRLRALGLRRVAYTVMPVLTDHLFGVLTLRA